MKNFGLTLCVATVVAVTAAFLQLQQYTVSEVGDLAAVNDRLEWALGKTGTQISRDNRRVVILETALNAQTNAPAWQK